MYKESRELQFLDSFTCVGFLVLKASVIFLHRTSKTSLIGEGEEVLAVAAHLVLWVLSVASIAIVAASILDSSFFCFFECIIFNFIFRLLINFWLLKKLRLL